MERLQANNTIQKSHSAKSVSSNALGADDASHSDLTAEKQPYLSHQPDSQGHIHYSDDENAMWQALLTRQAKQIPNRACSAYLEGLEKLNLPSTHIPQLHDTDEILQATTGWQTAAVPALISFGKFFKLLANKRFPVATFIRRFEEMDHVEKQVIFNRLVGHCPLLAHPGVAALNKNYAKWGINGSKDERVFLAPIYWLTIWLGLRCSHAHNHRIYVRGILSAPSETAD